MKAQTGVKMSSEELMIELTQSPVTPRGLNGETKSELQQCQRQSGMGHFLSC